MASPIDRIHKALGDSHRIAAFDRALSAYASRIEEISTANESSDPSFGARFNSGKFIEARVERDERWHVESPRG